MAKEKESTKVTKTVKKGTGAKNSTSTKSKTTAKVTKKSTEKKVNDNKKSLNSEKKHDYFLLHKVNKKVTIILIIIFGILLIVSTYAWFSTNLNVKIKTFNMLVTKNDGLSISFDAINYDTIIEISKDELLKNLVDRYPNNESQWASNGLVPVSSNGIPHNDTQFFDFYESDGVLYSRKDKENGFLFTEKRDVRGRKEFNYFIAFDLFFKNDSGSPIPDNLYLDTDTAITADGEIDEEMQGLLNSVRIGFVPIGSLPHESTPEQAQNMQCNNQCRSIIYEPNSLNHTNMSIERSQKYGITLLDGMKFPTYAMIKEGGPIYVRNSVSGSPYIDKNVFDIQETLTDADLDTPLFKIPDGITKMRVYLWIEGQDIDSLETNSVGADLSVSISFVKDTEGYSNLNPEE